MEITITRSINIPEDPDCFKCEAYETDPIKPDKYGEIGFITETHWCNFFNVRLEGTRPCWDCKRKRQLYNANKGK